MLVIGIDPGINGSICFFDDGKIIDLIEMPSMASGKKNKRQVNGAQIYNEISNRPEGLSKKNVAVVIKSEDNLALSRLAFCSLRHSMMIGSDSTEGLIDLVDQLCIHGLLKPY